MDKVVKVWNLGLIHYTKALKLQKYLVQKHHRQKDAINNTILCLEHHPVYTVGIRKDSYTVEEEEKLRKLGADFYRTDRGGLITFHGPGQLVVYPILNLKDFKPSMKWYVCNIEKTVILLCEQLGITAKTSPHTGVWIGDNKVCAIGVHGSRFVTSHGLALNCNVDLDWFNHIIPCGIEGKGVISLSKELQRNVDIEDVIPLFMDCFSTVFQCNYLNYDEDECIQEMSLATAE